MRSLAARFMQGKAGTTAAENRLGAAGVVVAIIVVLCKASV
jgi:hypothetical protein